MNVLITNDDGVHAPGLHTLFRELEKAGHKVTAVAPLAQQSGKAHSLTVFEPLRCAPISTGDGFKGFGISGTPTDCVKLALATLVDEKPDLVISGINDGQNVGPDVFYSGTIGAAAEAAHAGIPAIAVSFASQEKGKKLDDIARHLVVLIEKLDWKRLPQRRVLNINYPPCGVEEAQGVRVCPQSQSVWENEYREDIDPRGEKLWWLRGKMHEDMSEKSDRLLLQDNYITVTPLQFDFTDRTCLDHLAGMGLNEPIADMERPGAKHAK